MNSNMDLPTPRGGQKGFTLLEVLVALAIAAVALVTLTSRVGASADTQLSLSRHALALQAAVNVLEQQRLKAGIPTKEEHGEVEMHGQTLQWRTIVEKTQVDGFVRVKVEVTAPGEPAVKLFLFRAAL